MARNNFCKSLAFLFLFFLAESGSQAAQPKNLGAEVAKLKNLLEKKEISTTAFNDSRFKIYRNISKLFKKERKIDYLSKEFGFYTEESFQEGLKFLKVYANLLKTAEKKFDVSKEEIAGILKIESNFGKIIGKRHLLNTFVSMYITTKRKNFALKEIETILTQKEIDPFTPGSYGGAFGYSQSIPTSWIKFAVDFDTNNVKEPFNITDAIGFIANYLSCHGFKHNKEKAIFNYNHDKKYVSAVKAYAEELRKRKSNKEENSFNLVNLAKADLENDRRIFKKMLKSGAERIKLINFEK